MDSSTLAFYELLKFRRQSAYLLITAIAQTAKDVRAMANDNDSFQGCLLGSQ